MNRMMKALKSGFRWPETAASRETAPTATAPTSETAPTKAPQTARAAPKRARPRGLGDVVKSATSAVGITPCGGCQKRAEWLNRKFPLG